MLSENKKDISVVIPVYNAEGVLFELIDRIKKSIINISSEYEIILVEDCSRDDSKDEIGKIRKHNSNIIPVYHKKNVGQHISILHGLQKAVGIWIIVMDCDMQDLPEEIPNLFSKANEENKIILAARSKKQFPVLKKLYSQLFNSLLSVITQKKYYNTTGNFGVYHHDVINKIKNIPEHKFYLPAAIRNTDYKIILQNVQHGERKSGISAYNFLSLLKLSFVAIRASLFRIKTKSV